jgi:hypothetical protein
LRKFCTKTSDFAGRGLGQIQRQALLVTIIGFEVKVVAALGRGGGAADREDRAAGIALVALFDLDDLGAEVGQHGGRHRTLLPNRPIDDPNAFQWCIHGFPYTTERGGSISA